MSRWNGFHRVLTFFGLHSEKVKPAESGCQKRKKSLIYSVLCDNSVVYADQ